MRLSIRSWVTEWKGLRLLLLAKKQSRTVVTSNKTQSMATLNESTPYGIGSGSGPRCQDTILGDVNAQTRIEMHVEAKVDRRYEQSTKPDDSIADEAVTTASVDDSVVPTTIEEITSKDKGKGIMIEPEVPLKRKYQIALDEQIARDVQAKLDAELLEEQKLARKQEEEANIALIESWENTQAMMKADRLLAERLQSKEREELTDEEKAKLFMELMEKRRKHFAALRAQEKRNRPPTKAQKRTQMSTYLKHMGGYTYKQLKGKSFDEIQKLFDKEMKRVNTFVAMGSEVQESKEKKEEGREEIAKEVTAAQVHNGNYAKCAVGGKITTVSRIKVTFWKLIDSSCSSLCKVSNEMKMKALNASS
ncbi:hypothetical protein Tco_1172486 [Tanacetum coccineum]